jgi:hypothetical protein
MARSGRCVPCGLHTGTVWRWRAGAHLSGRAGFVALTQGAKSGDFAPGEAGERTVNRLYIVTGDRGLVGALGQRGLQGERGGRKIGHHRVVPAPAETGRQFGLATARRGGLFQFPEDLVERAIHQVDQRVGVAERGCHGGSAQTGSPSQVKGVAVGQEGAEAALVHYSTACQAFQFRASHGLPKHPHLLPAEFAARKICVSMANLRGVLREKCR